MSLLFEELTRKIIGAAMEVHSTLGPGFLEAVYQEALEMELKLRGLAFVTQEKLAITYKGKVLHHTYKPDIVVEGKVIVEIKAQAQLTTVDEAQAINYLKGTGCQLALVFNFGARSLQWKRLVHNA